MSDHPHDAPPPHGYVPHPLSHPPGDSAPSHCILQLPTHVKTAVDQARALAFQPRGKEHMVGENSSGDAGQLAGWPRP